VIGTDVEALVGRPAGDAGAGNADAIALDRERLQRELATARMLLDAARARLANASFMSKAPPAVVDGARAREMELADQVRRLEERLGA
jgi:valyl-tRNA synthetase